MNVSTIGIRPYRIGNEVKILYLYIYVYIYIYTIFSYLVGYLMVERPHLQFFTFRPQVGFSILYPMFIKWLGIYGIH